MPLEWVPGRCDDHRMPWFAYPDPPLERGSVRLREWGSDDLPCIEEASRDSEITRRTSVPSEYTAERGRAFIEQHRGRDPSLNGLSFAIADRVTDTALGLIILMRRSEHGVGGLGYWVVESSRGQGRAATAIGLLARWALGSTYLVRVEARVMPDNRASVGALERAGFTYEGVLRSHLVIDGEGIDMASYSLIATDIHP